MNQRTYFSLFLMSKLFRAQTKLSQTSRSPSTPNSFCVFFGEAGLKWRLATGHHFKECLVADKRVAVAPYDKYIFPDIALYKWHIFTVAGCTRYMPLSLGYSPSNAQIFLLYHCHIQISGLTWISCKQNLRRSISLIEWWMRTSSSSYFGNIAF